MHWVLQSAIAADQLLNALLGGKADETLSARAYRHRQQKRRWAWAYRLINAAFFWQADHCFEAYTSELLRHHLPREYKNG